MMTRIVIVLLCSAGLIGSMLCIMPSGTPPISNSSTRVLRRRAPSTRNNEQLFSTNTARLLVTVGDSNDIIVSPQPDPGQPIHDSIPGLFDPPGRPIPSRPKGRLLGGTPNDFGKGVLGEAIQVIFDGGPPLLAVVFIVIGCFCMCIPDEDREAPAARQNGASTRPG